VLLTTVATTEPAIAQSPLHAAATLGRHTISKPAACRVRSSKHCSEPVLRRLVCVRADVFIVAIAAATATAKTTAAKAASAVRTAATTAASTTATAAAAAAAAFAAVPVASNEQRRQCSKVRCLQGQQRLACRCRQCALADRGRRGSVAPNGVHREQSRPLSTLP
jgi:hypothetical protein